MINKIISFVADYYLLIGIAGIVIAILAIRFKMIRKKEAQVAWEKELRTDNLIDKSSLKKPYINTNSIEKKLYEITRQVIYSKYAQDPTSLPVDSLDYDLYLSLYNELKRDYELNIKKTIIKFDMLDSAIIEQGSESLSVITQLTVESFFEISYTTYHVSFGQKKSDEAFKQKFIFINQLGQWSLSQICPPESASDYEWDLVHQKQSKKK